ncbi:MAG: tRNA(His) guanylyltransferase Thg1 family protein [Nanoarchaeota archaeon]
MEDSFGDRMKFFEGMESDRRFLPYLPICARLDGKCFSSYTKGLKRPYDKRFSETMIEVTKLLVQETNACIGYTESDEISICWYSDSYKSEIWFGGRIQKMNSILASMTTSYFTSFASGSIPEKRGRFPLFDCRVWQLPTLVEATNVFLWRELDATKNAISMAARCYYSHKELNKKSGNEMQEMLFKKGINFNDYPSFFKRGTFVQRQTKIRKFTQSELISLPEKHEARKNPDLMVERREVVALDMPKFSTVVNKIGVIFKGEEPLVVKENNGSSN